MAEDKIYADGWYVREKTFPSTGNTILSVSIKADQAIAFLNQHKDEQGFVRIGISRRRTESEKGLTHTVWLDTWRPQAKQAQQPAHEQRKEQDDKIPF